MFQCHTNLDDVAKSFGKHNWDFQSTDLAWDAEDAVHAEDKAVDIQNWQTIPIITGVENRVRGLAMKIAVFQKLYPIPSYRQQSSKDH